MLPLPHFWRDDQLLDEGDMAGAETWHRILNGAAAGKGAGGGGEGALRRG
jgi:hypothetical protein